jgi:hypothetical protein
MRTQVVTKKAKRILHRVNGVELKKTKGKVNHFSRRLSGVETAVMDLTLRIKGMEARLEEREGTYWKWLETCNARKIENALQAKLISDVNAFGLLTAKLIDLDESLKAISRGAVYAHDKKVADMTELTAKIKDRTEVNFQMPRGEQ